ncbi:MAG TPA: hypothetical protein DD471_16000 [Planctomycetes bacterium]|nr:hypothetical protein [Planctomycetota bacterium]
MTTPATATAPAEISLTGIRKTFRTRKGTVTALDDFTLQVSGGEFVAILGPSGCGKSTALRMAAGLDV